MADQLSKFVTQLSDNNKSLQNAINLYLEKSQMMLDTAVKFMDNCKDDTKTDVICEEKEESEVEKTSEVAEEKKKENKELKTAKDQCIDYAQNLYECDLSNKEEAGEEPEVPYNEILRKSIAHSLEMKTKGEFIIPFTEILEPEKNEKKMKTSEISYNEKLSESISQDLKDKKKYEEILKKLSEKRDAMYKEKMRELITKGLEKHNDCYKCKICKFYGLHCNLDEDRFDQYKDKLSMNPKNTSEPDKSKIVSIDDIIKQVIDTYVTKDIILD